MIAPLLGVFLPGPSSSQRNELESKYSIWHLISLTVGSRMDSNKRRKRCFFHWRGEAPKVPRGRVLCQSRNSKIS